MCMREVREEEVKKPARCQQCKARKAVTWKEVFWPMAGEYVELHVCEECARCGEPCEKCRRKR